MSSKIKVYELAKELGQDSQHLVEVIQRLGVDIKNSMSVLGTEEVRTIREHFRKLRPLTRAVAAPTSTRSPVTEKRVGATVIRRRSQTGAKKGAEPTAEPMEMEASAPLTDEMVLVEGVEEMTEPMVQEMVNQEEPALEEAEASESVGASDASAAPTKEAPRGPRRFYPSIIKKVATEEYLGEKIGPKVERKKEPVKVITPTPGDRKPKVATGTTPATTTQVGVGIGLKRVKEIEFGLSDAAKEAAGKKKLLERQTSVFKSSDYLKRELIHATKKKKAVLNRPVMKTQITTAAAHKRIVQMAQMISVSELAKGMGAKASAVISKLVPLGVMATMNEQIDLDTATLVAHEFGFEVKQEIFREEDFIPTVDLKEGDLRPRPPVVTIMGHVDHGKTSLLDAIRKTKVAEGEAGGITQHVGAYTVDMPKGRIVFLDTPGHEAFTAMRARGAKVTDIVILVVSAVDGVMPQTLESVNHAKAAKVPIIVAVNKIDLPDANPDRIKQTLAGHELNPEEWGGDTIYANVSAKTGKGLDQLLESILLQAEVLELKANFSVAARGTVIESRLDKNRGPVASVLVQHGELKTGDVVACGSASGKIRAMTNSAGKRADKAGPSEPVEILGLSEVPGAGDELVAVNDEKAARELTSVRGDQVRAKAAEASRPRLTLEAMLAAPEGEKEIRLILKTDVQGSCEALKEAFTKLPADKVKLKVLHSATGGITESDVMLASASRASIVGFNVRPDVKAQKLAEIEHVGLRTYNIIYDLLDDVRKLLEGMVDSVVKEKVIGRAEVRNIFQVPKVGTVAGSAVIDGKVIRGCFLRLLRDSRVVYEGKLSSLRRFKEDVREVQSGFECGIGLENFNDLKLGDQLEAFVKEETKGTL